MNRKHPIWIFALVLSMALVFSYSASAIAGLTTQSATWLLNSRIDNTPIGVSTPSSATFTSATVNGNLTTNGNVGATGALNVSGSSFLTTLNASNVGISGGLTVNGTLTANGLLSGSGGLTESGTTNLQTVNAVTGNITGNLGVSGTITGTGLLVNYGFFGGATPSFFPTAGQWITWNASVPGFGATEFHNNHAGGSGGYFWFEGATGSSSGTNTMTLSSAGNLTLTGSLTAPTGISTSGNISGNVIGATGGFNGNLNGNATTATALASSCSQAGGPSATPGSGCVAIPFPIGYVGGAISVPPGGRSLAIGMNFPMANTTYAASCSPIGTTSGRPVITSVVKGTSSITVFIDTIDGAGATMGGLDCTAVGGR